jgi:hypothetical protein
MKEKQSQPQSNLDEQLNETAGCIHPLVALNGHDRMRRGWRIRHG